MKPIIHYLEGIILLFLIALCFESCTSDMDVVDFKLNDREIVSAEGNDFPQDEAAFLEVQTGDTIVLYDISRPRSSFSSNTWDLNSDLQVEEKDKEFVPVVFNSPGTNKITLCVNGSTQCVSKWVKVIGRTATPENTNPFFTIISPTLTGRTTRGKEVEVKARTTNILNLEDLSVMVNSRPVKDFKFDREEELLTVLVKLTRKNNEVVLLATTNSGSTTEKLDLVSTAFDVVAAQPPPPPKAPIVDVIGATVSSETESSKIDLEFKSSVGKRNLKVNANGTPVSANMITLSRGKGTVRSLPLQLGMNKIQIVAENVGGKTITNYEITRVPAAEPVVEVEQEPATPPPPNQSIGSNIDWFGVPTRNVNLESCSSYSVNETSMKIGPKQRIVLMGCSLYSSGCGTVTLTLSAGSGSISETFELSKGKNQVTFSRLNEKELDPSISYKLNLKTGESPNCGEEIPSLLDAKVCGKFADGNSRVAINYGTNLSIFSIKYKY